MEFTDKSINDLTQRYFTDIVKDKYKKGLTTKRFTFTESIYLNKSPKSLSEAQKRYIQL